MRCNFVRCEEYGERHKCCCNTCSNIAYASDPDKCYAECNKGPSNLQKAINFTKAATKYVLAGSPPCTPEQIEERFSICKVCQYFRRNEGSETEGVCSQVHCGCNIKSIGGGMNKLAWATEACPIGKWPAIDANIDANVTDANNIPF